MNKVILIGRLTKDPELRKTQTDISVCRFSIAVNREYQKGEEQKADFISCVAWRNQADNLCKYQHKGSLIGVDGSIQTETYDDANGVRKTNTEVLVNRIEFLESAKKQEQPTFQEKEQQYQQANENWKQQAFPEVVNKDDISADDLPF